MLVYNNQTARRLYYGSLKVLAAYIGSSRVHRDMSYLPFDNGAEPSGAKVYFTPDGAGDADGTSWANAYPISSINAALLTTTTGNYYFASGNYTTSWTMAIPEGVNLFGGFNGDMSWSSRNSFTNPTTFTGTDAFIAKAGTDYRALDGFTLVGYSSVGMNAKNLTVADNSGITVLKLNNSIFSNSTVTSNSCNVDDCNFTDCALTGVVDIVNSNVINQTEKNLAISGDATNCYFSKCSGALSYLSSGRYYHGMIKGNAKSCTINNCNSDSSHNYTYLIYGGATDCTINNCSCSGSGNSDSSYNYTYLIYGGATNCTINNCSCSSSSIYYTYLICGGATNCTIDSCSCSGSGSYSYAYLISSDATNCTINSCSCSSSSYTAYLISGNATDCTINNCSSSSSSLGFYSDTYLIYGGAAGCTISNCSCDSYNAYLISSDATNCTINSCSCSGSSVARLVDDNAINCIINNCNCSSNVAVIVYNDIINCTITNCCSNSCLLFGNAVNTVILNYTGENLTSSSFYIFKHNTIANCTISSFAGSYYNNILFNNSADLSPTAGTGNAQSSYHANNAITLGTDNSIAKFVDLGTIDAVGYQEDLTCPNPITDRAGFDSFVASFGDWHLQPTTLLAGAGVYVANVTTDRDGVIRPNPPTIGAYEPNTI